MLCCVVKEQCEEVFTAKGQILEARSELRLG